jgi:hypothetical protein
MALSIQTRSKMWGPSQVREGPCLYDHRCPAQAVAQGQDAGLVLRRLERLEFAAVFGRSREERLP